MAERTDRQHAGGQRPGSSRPEEGAGAGQHGRSGEEPDAARDFAAQTGYRPSVNQAREEPVPASHHEDRDQEAVLRNEELGQGHREEPRQDHREEPRQGHRPDGGPAAAP